MDKLSAYAKAAAAFVLTVIANLVSNLVNGTTPLPQNGGEWATLLITSTALALGVAVIPNTTTDPAVAREQSVRLKGARHALPE
jgi:hypothetical protein